MVDTITLVCLVITSLGSLFVGLGSMGIGRRNAATLKRIHAKLTDE